MDKGFHRYNTRTMKKVALIMAGGKGERLWPLSTYERPKQLIPLIEGKTLLDMAIERVKGLADFIILTNKAVAKKLNSSLPMIVEPEPKNTAPALIYATYHIHKTHGNTLIAALPSDHYITPINEFQKDLNMAFEYAYKTKNIITFGIKPTYPHTGYGYIEKGERIDDKIYKVLKFHEKPSIEKAEEYVKSGRFYWNSGMFVWESESFLKEVERLAKDIYEILNLPKEEFFKKVKDISIDYAIMEKTENIMVIEAGFNWIDVGSYGSLYEILPKDEDGNAYMNNKPLSIKSRKNLSISKNKVVFIGLENVAVVESEGIIMVLNLKNDQDVKEAARKFLGENFSG